jgi:hypothetical protein
MPEEIDVTPLSRRKGLLAFYIGIGVASLLVVGACFAWKPLRVWQCEKYLMSMPRPDFTTFDTEAIDASEGLVAIGPQAIPAIKRVLVRDENLAGGYLLDALYEECPIWAVELLVEHSISGWDDDVRCACMSLVEEATGKDFGCGNQQTVCIEDESFRKMVDWWQAEGKAMYGSGK